MNDFFDETTGQNVIDFSEVINALLDNENIFPPSYLHRFSDLNRRERSKLREIWHKVAPKRKTSLFDDLISLAEADTTVLFDHIGRIGLDDDAPAVRRSAINLLWECSNTDLITKFLDLLMNDESISVKAAAASALGQFVYLGELDEIPAHFLKDIEEGLLTVLVGNDPSSVKRKAIESFGYSSRKEVPAIIQSAYDSNEKEWMASSLFAMGVSADDGRWEKAILRQINSPLIDIQFEAVRAAGRLELTSAIDKIIELLADYTYQDEFVRTAAITSLSQIGGVDAQQMLESLLEVVDDEDELEILETGLEFIKFLGGSMPMGMFDLGMGLEGIDDDFDDEATADNDEE